MADLQKAPIATESVARIDASFAIEREINGRAPDKRQAVRQRRFRALVASLEAWLRASRAKLSPQRQDGGRDRLHAERWPAFTRFLDDGRICLSNNAAERAIRPLAVGRRNWTFAGSDSGGRRAAATYTLIEIAKLTGIDPRAWLPDVLARPPE